MVYTLRQIARTVEARDKHITECVYSKIMSYPLDVNSSPWTKLQLWKNVPFMVSCICLQEALQELIRLVNLYFEYSGKVM
jgi:hypothetical protein